MSSENRVLGQGIFGRVTDSEDGYVLKEYFRTDPARNAVKEECEKILAYYGPESAEVLCHCAIPEDDAVHEGPCKLKMRKMGEINAMRYRDIVFKTLPEHGDVGKIDFLKRVLSLFMVTKRLRQAGMINLDFKADNVVVSFDGEPVFHLVDFGRVIWDSKVPHPSEKMSPRSMKPWHVRWGPILGEAREMPVISGTGERVGVKVQYWSKAQDHAFSTNLYSLGATIIQLYDPKFWQNYYTVLKAAKDDARALGKDTQAEMSAKREAAKVVYIETINRSIQEHLIPQLPKQIQGTKHETYFCGIIRYLLTPEKEKMMDEARFLRFVEYAESLTEWMKNPMRVVRVPGVGSNDYGLPEVDEDVSTETPQMAFLAAARKAAEDYSEPEDPSDSAATVAGDFPST